MSRENYIRGARMRKVHSSCHSVSQAPCMLCLTLCKGASGCGVRAHAMLLLSNAMCAVRMALPAFLSFVDC